MRRGCFLPRHVWTGVCSLPQQQFSGSCDTSLSADLKETNKRSLRSWQNEFVWIIIPLNTFICMSSAVSQTQQQVLTWQSLHALTLWKGTMKKIKIEHHCVNPRSKRRFTKGVYIYQVKLNMTELSRAAVPQKDNNHTLSALDDHPFLKTSLFLSSHLCSPPPTPAPKPLALSESSAATIAVARQCLDSTAGGKADLSRSHKPPGQMPPKSQNIWIVSER